MDADRFKKLLLETDPSAYTMMDSSINQYNRDSYTGAVVDGGLLLPAACLLCYPAGEGQPG